jgi:hypothetical protein
LGNITGNKHPSCLPTGVEEYQLMSFGENINRWMKKEKRLRNKKEGKGKINVHLMLRR